MKKSLDVDAVQVGTVPLEDRIKTDLEEIRRQQETEQQTRLRRSEELIDQLEQEGILVWQVSSGQKYEVEVSWRAIREQGGDHGAFVDWLKRRATAAIEAQLLQAVEVRIKNQAWVIKLLGSQTEKPSEIVILDEEGHVLNTVSKEMFKA